MKILICDDRKDGCEDALSHLEKVGRADDAETLFGDSLRKALAALFEGTDKFLTGCADSARVKVPEELANFDLVIFDNNLADLDFGGARLTAESVVGYLRSFTGASYIISLNKNPSVDFDLRHLFGDHSSIADLALNTHHLSRPRLWGGKDDDFAPWYWPRLPDAAAKRKKQIAFVRENLDQTVWKALGFPDEAVDYMSRRSKALASRSSMQKTIQEVSFRDVFSANGSLDREATESIDSLARESVPWAVKAVCRITAAEVDRWLRREVLAPQDVLIDLPHLVTRMPSLLGTRACDLAEWNGVIAVAKAPYGLSSAAYRDHVRSTRFQPHFWLSTPCFWWPTLKANSKLRQQLFESKVKWPDAVFCEDVSAFVAVDTPEPIEIEADIEGSWPRRYIAQRADVNYSPRSRIIG
ncbi:MAG: hypothetical protein OXU70_08955 [Gammaproteobacteria bacterium]|nr:hypothetical protein [Gammaproteobacteria bacterium]